RTQADAPSAPPRPDVGEPTAAPGTRPAHKAGARTGAELSLAEEMEAEAIRCLGPAEGPGGLGRLGPYRVLRVLGSGGMGVVFEAEDPALRRKLALKVMSPGFAVGDGRARFLREAQATAALEHDHVVRVHKAGEDRGVLWIAMQL